MPDLEKVIRGLEICSTGDVNCTKRDCTACSYYPAGYTGCTAKRLMRDALELLKAQTGRWVNEPDRVNHWHCSVCGRTEGITHRAMAYCPGCGAKMEPPKEET